jgi:RNA polymerase sigma-70 factor (ECF subfamily)
MGTTTTPQRDQLAKRLAHDLDGAFPDLVRQTVDGLFSGVRRLAPQVAEEITQETYIRAYRALQGYGSERVQQLKIQGWLWTIALNLCRNAARTRSTRQRTR